MPAAGLKLKFVKNTACVEAPGGEYKKGASYYIANRNAIPFLNNKQAVIDKGEAAKTVKKEKAVKE